MPDPFLLLTPILLLAVVGLLGFVGCAGLLGLDDVTYTATLKIESLDPPSRPVCGASFMLTVKGSGFKEGAKLTWPGRETLFADPITTDGRLITVPVPGSYLDQAGQVDVAVLNTDGNSSPLYTFTVTPGRPRDVFFSPKPPSPTVDAQNRLAGDHGGLHFDAGAWKWDAGDRIRKIQGNIRFSPGGNSRMFSFAGNQARILRSIDVYTNLNEGPVAAQIELKDTSENNPPAKGAVTFNEGVKEIATGWTRCTRQVEVTFKPSSQPDRGDQLGIVKITYAEP